MTNVLKAFDSLRGLKRRNEWRKCIGVLESTCVEFYRATKGLECETRFFDLTSACKKVIFEKVVSSIRISGNLLYPGQLEDCKYFVQCKVLNRSWRYWIGKSVSGVEMRINVIDIDI